MTTIDELIKSRTSANNHDTSRKLSGDEIARLIELATYSPSAFNFQNWKFIAVRSDEATFNGWVGAAKGMYSGNSTRQRDEAVRSGAMAAMTLMLAAQGRGLVSCPMIGFDQAGVAAEFGLLASDLPVMLVTVGHPAAGNWPQKPRKAVSQALSFA